MNFSNFITFSAFDHASDVVKRLAVAHRDNAESIARFFSKFSSFFCNTVDVTREWQDMNDSTEHALSWEIFPGLVMVCAILDDDEFGLEIKWFFSENARDVLNLKQAVILVESFMNIIVKGSRMDDVILRINGIELASKDLFETGAIGAKSDLFCFTLTKDNFFPVYLTEFTRSNDLEQIRKRFSSIASMLLGKLEIPTNFTRCTLASWKVFSRVSLELSLDETRGSELSLSMQPSTLLSSAIRPEILIICKMHLDIISNLLQKLA